MRTAQWLISFASLNFKLKRSHLGLYWGGEVGHGHAGRGVEGPIAHPTVSKGCLAPRRRGWGRRGVHTPASVHTSTRARTHLSQRSMSGMRPMLTAPRPLLPFFTTISLPLRVRVRVCVTPCASVRYHVCVCMCVCV